MIRRVAAILFGMFAALLLLEGTLQAASYVMLRRERKAQAHPAETIQTFSGRGVLCVGDSYTYGIGTSSREASYPSRLEEHLNDSGGSPSWIVANEGWPSRNSQELAETLPHLLEEYDPDWVIVLIGINDRWSDVRATAAGSPPADPRAWTWKWRSKRLFEIAWANLRGAKRSAEAPEDSPQVAAQDSTAATNAPPAGSGSTEPPALADSAASLLATPSDSVSVLRRRLQNVLDSDTSKVATPEQRSEVYAIAQEAQRIGSEELAIDVVEAYSRLRMHSFAVEEGLAALKRHGESPRLARALVPPLGRARREDEALRFAERSVQLDSLDAENWRVLAAARFQIPDLEGGLRALLEFQKRGGDDAVVARQIRGRNLAASITPEQLEVAIRHAQIPESQAERMRALFGEMSGPTEHELALLSNLDRIADLIREHGARPLFLNYPTPEPLAPAAQNRCVAEVAEREGIPFVDLRSLLEREAAARPHEKLFIADGHCTDSGYDIVAKAVAEMLLELERAVPSS